MLKRLLSRFTNSLVILLGAYLILLGLINLVPEALAEFNDSYPPQPGALAPPVVQQAADPPSQAPLPDPIQPLAPLEPSPDPASIPDSSLPAAPGLAYEMPSRLVIPAIQLDAPVVQALPALTSINGQEFRIWDVPAGYLAGWHTDSAWLGQPGNMVLNGHHNVHGQVFARLIDLEVGAEILVGGQTYGYRYRVTERLLLPEKDQPLEVRLANAHYILPTSDTRLTLVTCWPYETNTHRLIIIAEPAP
jgi:LPXTG-site transpeptidase (sortase) family protein